MYLELSLTLLGLVLLVKGADYFVKSASGIAKSFGISEFTIGLTLVAIGTSLPELVSSIFAAMDGESGLILGTVFGANIANICLIVGLAACFAVIKTDKKMLTRDGFIMTAVFFLVFLFILDGTVLWWEGIILISLFLAYTIFLFERAPRGIGLTAFGRYYLTFSYARSLLRVRIPKRKRKISLWKDLIMLLVGGGLVLLGADLLVENALKIASGFLLPPMAIGIIVAIGTTMPEMSVAITAARKGMGNLVIGNAVGSCITNSLLIIGIASIIHPLAAGKISMFFVVPFMIVTAVVLLFFVRSHWKVHKLEGATFLGLYLGFLLLVYKFSVL